MSLRVLFFGMEGVFSRAPLLELINARFHIPAIVVPRPEQSEPAREPIRQLAPPHAPESDVPLLYPPRDLNIIGIAWNAGIDIYEVSTLRDERVLAMLQQLQPDIIVVACFPLLLPNRLSTKYPCLNLHPSLLPEYRGPSPLFWIFHDGLEHAGVTVHLMDEHADTGDIIAQEPIELPDGVRYTDGERILSEHAAGLLINALGAVQNGTFARTPQPNIAAPRAPKPSERDFVIAPDWTARRAFNFIRGITQWNQPITIEVSGKRLIVQEAIAYDANQEMLAPFQRMDAGWKIRCSRGTLTVMAKEKDT